MKVSCLVDNLSARGLVKCEHAFSLFIDSKGQNILIDCGETGTAMIENSKIMKIDLKTVDIVVISHHHYDHLGGLWHFLKHNKKCKVYMKKPDFDISLYGRVCVLSRDIGYQGHENKFDLYKDRIIYVEKEILEVGEDLVLITKFGDTYPRPLTNSICYQYSNKESKYKLDDFYHELAVLYRGKEVKECLLVSPCSHHGILNIVEKTLEVMKSFRDERKLNIIGGFHYGLTILGFYDYKDTEDAVEKVGELLDGNELLNTIHTGHCSTYWGYQTLKRSFRDKRRMRYMYGGEELVFE